MGIFVETSCMLDKVVKRADLRYQIRVAEVCPGIDNGDSRTVPERPGMRAIELERL